MNIGFALIPNPLFLEQVIEVQSKIKQKYSLEPSFSMETNLPHVTILQGNFQEELDYEKAAQILSQQIEDIDISLTFTDFIHKGLGWFFLLCQKEPWLLSLHQTACTLLIDDMVVTEETKQADDLMYLSPLEKYNHLTYSYRYMGEAYLPHITLGRYITKSHTEILLDIQEIWQKYSISPLQSMDRLTVYKMGVNGAHAKTLWETKLPHGGK
ncbi:hypothetical protein [Shimazuella kribbensis]|uniref:hypothetical protein n=1 Tax=Shimazuella kribbensis TaxID=139808 RepID=UPI00041D3D5D|nr:hypothetical protein [Shimazuella kribbensis]